jgi:hypothetical protein
MDTKRGPAAGTAYEIGIVDLTQKKMTASFDLGRPRQMIVPPIRPNFHSYGWAAGPYGTHLRNCRIEVSECNRDFSTTTLSSHRQLHGFH